jgi:predicted transcriptional regulator
LRLDSGELKMEVKSNLAELATDIVASYVSNNEVPRGDMPKFIHEVYQALALAMDGKPTNGDASAGQRHAAHNKKTIFPDYLICLEDGKRYKSLKRHLRTSYKLTPELYREKWGLPVDYPMVAPNYAQTRSNLAKSIGLGKQPLKKK